MTAVTQATAGPRATTHGCAELSGSGLVPQQIEQHPPDKINSVGALLENQNWSNVGMQVLRSGELAHILRPVVYVIALRR